MRILDTATSALGAFSVDMMVRANNVSNINTPEFKAQNVTLTTGPADRGVAVGSLYKDTSAGALIPGGIPPSGMVEASNTDLGREFTHMVSTEIAYKANATVVRTTDEMAGTLLDMFS